MTNTKEYEDLDVLQSFKHTQDKSVEFNLPVERERSCMARLSKANVMNQGIERGLLKVAGVLAYNELKMQAKGGQPLKKNSILEKRSTLVSQVDSQNIQQGATSAFNRNSQARQNISNKDKITVVSSEGLIRFADYQIDKEVEANAIESGKMRYLSSHEKGKMIVKFLQMRNKPFKNREFYSQFFEQHEKAEKIKVLEGVSQKI